MHSNFFFFSKYKILKIKRNDVKSLNHFNTAKYLKSKKGAKINEILVNYVKASKSNQMLQNC